MFLDIPVPTHISLPPPSQGPQEPTSLRTLLFKKVEVEHLPCVITVHLQNLIVTSPTHHMTLKGPLGKVGSHTVILSPVGSTYYRDVVASPNPGANSPKKSDLVCGNLLTGPGCTELHFYWMCNSFPTHPGDSTCIITKMEKNPVEARDTS